jgi:hypothetical protein
MAASITVPATFMADWQLFCERAGLDRIEQQRLREQVRADFATVGAWVAETAAVYRFCDATWGYMPTAELCEGYLWSKRWWPADPTIFKRYGILLLARLCAQVAGAIPAQTAPQAADPVAVS